MKALSRPCKLCGKSTHTAYCGRCAIIMEAAVENPCVLRRAIKIVQRCNREGKKGQ